MSIILDALNKSNAQRPVESGGATSDDGYRAGDSRGVSRSVRTLLGGMVLAVLVGIWLGWSFRHDEQDSGVSAGTAGILEQEPANSDDQAALEAGTSARETAADNVLDLAGDGESSLEVSTAKDNRDDDMMDRSVLQRHTLATPFVDPAVASLYREARDQEREGALLSSTGSTLSGDEGMSESKTEAPENSQEETELDIEALLTRAQQALGQESLSEHPSPLLEMLSQQQKDNIPTIVYSQHDWNADQSSVVLNGERLNAGQRVGSIRVVEILSDSVVLRWQDIEFRLRALNSWINL